MIAVIYRNSHRKPVLLWFLQGSTNHNAEWLRNMSLEGVKQRAEQLLCSSGDQCCGALVCPCSESFSSLSASWLNQAVVCWLVGSLMSQQHVSVSQGWICSDNFTRCHTEIEVADPTFYPTQSQYTDTGPTTPCADPIMPGVWQGSHWSTNF